ncbi:pyridoxamine 5'-phosphate oxidase family protein [Streptomyces virginiae]|uniref:pyridoxamine 5'-phosphate oxidase family protein n=1 Tax=Streptomyces virginiae TaxID=1961 RepID=UPI0036539EF5
MGPLGPGRDRTAYAWARRERGRWRAHRDPAPVPWTEGANDGEPPGRQRRRRSCRPYAPEANGRARHRGGLPAARNRRTGPHRVHPPCSACRAPVSHLLDDGDIIVRVQDGSTLAAPLTAPDSPDVVVAYEVDAIDPDTRLGWSVVATGYASAVTDPTELNRYAQRLKSWADAPSSGAVRIRPGVVTGFRLRAVNS